MNEHVRFQEVLDRLIDGWCERRALYPLALLLPAYLAHTGRRESEVALYRALTRVRTLARDELLGGEGYILSEATALVRESLTLNGVRSEELDRVE
jgi:hypothetical protein